jgi:hypothetical protein
MLHPNDYAHPGHAAEIVRRMRTLPGVLSLHSIDGHAVFELAPPS